MNYYQKFRIIQKVTLQIIRNVMEIKDSVLVIVDISGYSKFLKQKQLSLLHAEDIITQLIESIIDTAKYPLTLNKLEGDAAFFYALTNDNAEAVIEDAFQQAIAFLSGFRRKAQELSNDSSYCGCDACTHIHQLKLKAIIHSGQVVYKKIRQFEELAGDIVIEAHQLLKNTIPQDNTFAKIAK